MKDKRNGYCRSNNAVLFPSYRTKSANVRLQKNVKKGEEIFTSYGREYFPRM